MTTLAVWLQLVASTQHLQDAVNGIAFWALLGCAAAALLAASAWMVGIRRQQDAGEHEHADTAHGDRTRGDRKGDTS